MSCFVMVRRASRPIPFRPAGAPSPVPAGSCRAAGLPGPSFGGSVLPHSECRFFIPFRSVSFRFAPFSPPPACPASGTLFRAYRGRGRASVGAGAVRAPDCACAREPRRRAHVSRPFLRGLFSRRREPEGETAPRMPTRLPPPYLAIGRRRSSLYRELFPEFKNTMPLSPRRGCSPARIAVRSGSGAARSGRTGRHPAKDH